MYQEKISETLGKGNRFYLEDRLNKVVEEFSLPYLDFVANMECASVINCNGGQAGLPQRVRIKQIFIYCFVMKCLLTG